MDTKIALWIAKAWHKRIIFAEIMKKTGHATGFSLIFKIVIRGYHLSDVIRDIKTEIVPKVFHLTTVFLNLIRLSAQWVSCPHTA